MKIHMVAEDPDEPTVEKPGLIDPGKRALYSADGQLLRKGAAVFVCMADDIVYHGHVRRIDFDEGRVVVGFGTFLKPNNVAFSFHSYTLGEGISFYACPSLGADQFRLSLYS